MSESAVFVSKKQAEDLKYACSKLFNIPSKSMIVGDVEIRCDYYLPAINVSTNYREDYVKNPSVVFAVKSDFEKDLSQILKKVESASHRVQVGKSSNNTNLVEIKITSSEITPRRSSISSSTLPASSEKKSDASSSTNAKQTEAQKPAEEEKPEEKKGWFGFGLGGTTEKAKETSTPTPTVATPQTTTPTKTTATQPNKTTAPPTKPTSVSAPVKAAEAKKN